WVIGKHPRGANDAEIEKLLDSMEQMVEDAVAAIPDDSSIELKAADGKADSSEVFRELITLSRSEISIALLGQNQTTEANSNKASAQAGLEVTADIRDADADIIQAAVNQVIRTVVTLNFGDVPCPVWAMWEQEAIDDTRATRDEKLTRAGLRLTPQYFMREYQLQEGDIDLSDAPVADGAVPAEFAEAISADHDAQQQLDDALDILMNGGVLNGTLEPVLAPLFKRVENGVNPTELLGELAELYPQMNTDDLQERLARILFVANIWGRLHERDNG
ncbi:TPA: DUF935 family protein, partial [Escherichia coli]|nr:DUF935 family protein [Escherichia coli]HBE9067555.1 DUF935 family protein [Escherichia coli]